MHLMKWGEALKSKVVGGLGLEKLNLKNWSLLEKWWWRYGEEQEALWRRVIVSKYGEDVWGWVPKRIPRYSMYGFGAVFSSFWDESNVRGKVFAKGLGFIVGEGDRVRFGHDDWAGVGPLRLLFPRVFTVCPTKMLQLKSVFYGLGMRFLGK